MAPARLIDTTEAEFTPVSPSSPLAVKYPAAVSQNKIPIAIVNKHGFPAPGLQCPSPEAVLSNDIFLSEDAWKNVTSLDAYDYVVIGSGCTALAFIDEALRLNPHTRIICLERGGLLLPTHFQNLSAPFKSLIGGQYETYPWTLSEETVKSSLGFCHGYYPFFGGRSLFWSGWSPQPSIKALRGYPESMKNAALDPEFWPRARELMNVVSAADLQDGVFDSLQRWLDQKLTLPLRGVPSLETSEPAQFAAGSKYKRRRMNFTKFSSADSMLSLAHRQTRKATSGVGASLHIGLNCTTEKVIVENGITQGIETSRGFLKLSSEKTKVVLCSGALPNTTILYNSLPDIRKTAGKRLTGHFISHVTARLPLSALTLWPEKDEGKLEIAARCMLGYHPITSRQYQIQITAVHSPDPDGDAEDLARECPDFSASATPIQLYGSEEHVLFMCAAIGEFSEHNSECWTRHDPSNPDETTNLKLQYLCNDEDNELWDYMEHATYQALGTLTESAPFEYWNKSRQAWEAKPPTSEEIRVKGVVHEASSTFVGPKSEGGSLDEMYRPYGCQDVFVTGAGIFPTAGAWNPTLTMCAYAQDLARKLQRGVDSV